MEWNALFFFNNVMLGVGLAMDAFSVSLANGLNEPDMKKKKDVRSGRGVCLVSGRDADGRMDLCAYHNPIFYGV